MEPIIEVLRNLTKEGANKENYYEDTPSDLNQLPVDLGKSTQGIKDQKRLKFADLFRLKGSYYERRKEVFQEALQASGAKMPDGYGDIIGLYLFFDEDEPIYVGNSRFISKRLRQHFLGRDHYSSSLVYLMARTFWEEQNNEEYVGLRQDLPDFEDMRMTLQNHMRESWEILVLPMSNPYERYLSEVYYAMHFKTYWNNFDTH